MSDNHKLLVGLQDESGPSTKTVTYSTALGRGAFATVYKAKCGLLPCAAKILYPIFVEDPAMNALIEKFYQECEYLKNIKHPNVVQYLGVCRVPDTLQPVLLMELMEQSLTHFLESSNAPLLRHVELSICHDVALALEYLHSVKIVHRDLSSNNVLLIGPGSRAKVSDFGMSRVIDTSKSKSMTPGSLTMVPGTVAYMPHEALGANPKYTEKIDCFSFGVLSIQVMTRQFPNPTNRFKEIESPLSPVGTAVVPVLETECRKEHIDMIDKSNPLLVVALDCLSLKRDQRPIAQELCQRIESLREDLAFEQLSIASGSELCRCTELQVANRLLKEKVTTLEQQLKAINSQVGTSSADASKSSQDCRDKLPILPSTLKLQPSHYVLSLTQWRSGAPIPRAVAASSSTTFGSSLYCHSHGVLYEYYLNNDKWTSFPSFPLSSDNVSLTMYEAYSTVFSSVDGKVYCMHDGKWHLQGEMRFKPWDIIRHQEYFIAFGHPNQIDVFQFVDSVLYKRSSYSAIVLDYASVTICGDALYFVGVYVKHSWISNVYKLSVAEILQIRKASWFSFDRDVQKVSVHEISPLPLVRSTCVSFKNHLLSVGGFKNKHACADIFRYDQDDDKWVLVGSIPTPRYNCLAEIVDGQLVVIGGWINQYKKCDLVEIATLNLF